MPFSVATGDDGPGMSGFRSVPGPRVERFRAGTVPLIAHVIYRLDVGGLENGLVNLINRLPEDRYQHVIICLTGCSANFQARIERNVPVYALNKRQGNDLGLFVRLWRLLRRLSPDLVHTRNLATLEAQLPAFLAGVTLRVHGEHGHDVHDLDNTRRRYRWLRLVYRPLIDCYIPLSKALEGYLIRDIGVKRRKISTICNGVDIERFHPAVTPDSRRVLPVGFIGGESPPMVIGTVGRLEAVKDQMTLARAFVGVLRQLPEGIERRRLRLVIVGDGSLRSAIQSYLTEAGVEALVWMPGNRDDVAACLQALDVFVLPSLGEGISNTILEAMATGLPIVATDVGGNAELVAEGKNGFLTPRGVPRVMADRLLRYIQNPDLLQMHGRHSRMLAEQRFSIARMVERYTGVYDRLLYP